MRAVGVILISLYVMALTAPGLTRPWRHRADVGLVVNYDGVIVNCGPAALAAGIKPGDRVDVSALPADNRYPLPVARLPAAGQKIALRIIHDHSVRTVVLTAQPPQYSAIDEIVTLAKFILLNFVFVAFGTVLVLLRPTKTTWGFYWYCLGFAIFPFRFWSFLPLPWLAALFASNFVLNAAGAAGFLAFGLNFGQQALRGWRQRFDRIVPWWFALTAACSVISVFLTGLRGAPTEWMHSAANDLRVAATVGGILALLLTYVEARDEGRGRLRWVFLGLAVGAGSFAVGDRLLSGVYFVPGTRYDLAFGLQLVGVLVPVTVAYAIIRHRVIDVRFAINRAMVYGTLTVIAVALFALSDLIFTKLFAATQVEIAVDIALALALGFGLNAVHGRAVRFVDRMFFRERYRARVRLERIVQALREAESQHSVDVLVTRETAQALSLTSAAIFHRLDDGGFVREESVGWNDDAAWHILPDEPLAMQLVATRDPVSLREIAWQRWNLPASPAEPTLALAVPAGSRSEAILLYGAHVNGAALDPDEIGALRDLAAEAGAAYSRLPADRSRGLEPAWM